MIAYKGTNLRIADIENFLDGHFLLCFAVESEVHFSEASCSDCLDDVILCETAGSVKVFALGDVECEALGEELEIFGVDLHAVLVEELDDL